MTSSKLFSNLCICFIFLDITNSLSVLDATNERKYKRQSDGFKCILPSYPDNGNWTVVNGIKKPGDAIDISVLIKFQCNQGYRLTPNQPYQECDEDTWNPLLLPKCLKSCPPLYSTPTMSVRCQDVTGHEISCAQSTDGTYLTYECEQFYEALGRQQSLYCSHGSWDTLPICQPVCGKKIDRQLSPLIYNGVDTAELEYPWIVALFIKDDGKFVNNCGGSLITTRMILTAAHCVTNHYAQALDKNILKVAAGKYYNEYDDARDKHAQYREVAELIVHEHFREATRNFQYDIALIVTKGLFILGPAVQPICIDNINSFHPHVGNNGEIAGWGLTEDSVAADHLKTLIIPYKDQTTCASELPSDWADRYNLDDKICGGFWKQNKSVCRGDSGSGLIFRNPDDNRYYIHGFVSISPTVIDGSCNSQSNVLFTNVAKYYQWLDRKRKKNHVEPVEECTLPSFPRNGMWRLVNSGKMRPGDMVPSNTILEFSCNEGHKLSSFNPKFYCAFIAQLPSCDLLCTIPVLPSEMRVSCSNSKQQKINCADAISGSSMSYSCPDGDETTSSDKIYCINGSWSNPNPKCNPKKRLSYYPVTPRGNISETSTSPSSCFLPDFPKNGKWSLFGGKGRPGDLVPESTLLRFECFQGYKLSSTPYVICDKHWSADFPECRKSCLPRYSTSTTILTCRDKEGYKISCSEATDGTLLTYQCTDNVLYESNTRRKTFYCLEGDWDNFKPECVPVCGVRNVNAKPLSFDTSVTKLYEFPWVTAIYMRINSTMKNVCGGTLITPRIVLTAAQCVFIDQNPAAAENIEIATGKQYLDYGDSRDTRAQYRKVSSIILHKKFHEKRLYLYDMALLVAEKNFILRPEVQPACYDDISLPPVGTAGEIAKWGKIQKGVQPDHLNTLRIIHKDQTICANELPQDFANKFFLHDKMCARVSRQNRSLCQGDTGSGLVFINPRDDRYYVQGIVSLAPPSADGACDSNVNFLLTLVSIYYQWIEENKSTIERCTLPPFPKNGRWDLENGNKKSPGQTALSPITVLAFTCDDGYILDSADSKYYCESPRFPTCEKLCPMLYFSPDALVECVDETNQKIRCCDAAQGAAMTFTCRGQNGETQSGSIRCNDGYWIGSQPTCVTKMPPQTPMGTQSPLVFVRTKSVITATKVICTYDVQWSANHEKIPETTNLCTHLVYSPIGLWSEGDVTVKNDSLEAMIIEIQSLGLYQTIDILKHMNPNLKILLNVGGRAVEHNLFSRLMEAMKRTLAYLGDVGSIFNQTYIFDGLNIDCDFPKEADKDRIILFLERVREDCDKNGWLLSATVRADNNGTGYDIPKLNKIFDWVTIKTYDLYGAETLHTSIHNALFASSKDTEDEKFHRNIDAIANNWLAAGLSKDKLVLSVAFHGRLSILKDSDNHSLHSPIIGPGPNRGFLKFHEICSGYRRYVKVWDDEQKSPYRYKDKE